MATCRGCGREHGTGSCRAFPTVRTAWAGPPARCPHCLTKAGRTHHVGCPFEACADCGKALPSCQCYSLAKLLFELHRIAGDRDVERAEVTALERMWAQS